MSNEEVTLRFTVTDTGIGIAPDKQWNIFDAFVQCGPVHHATVRRHRAGPDHLGAARGVMVRPGVDRQRARQGQPLSLHRQVRMVEPPHDARTALDAQVTEYAGAAPVAPAVVRTSRKGRAAPRHIRALVGRRQPDEPEAGGGALKQRGFKVVTVATGASPWSAPRAAVRCDPDGPADAGSGRSRGHARHPGPRAQTGGHTPIIALTAFAMPRDHERCRAVGMDAYVTKPIRPDELSPRSSRC
jgi:hypothetical protein